jgi:hypothetical protein
MATSDIHRCIWAWRRHVTSIFQQVENLPKTQYYELRYENLVTKPQEEAGKLLHFLGIVSEVSTQKLYQAFSNAKVDSIGRWKQELSTDQLQEIEREAGFLLEQLGYSSS